MPYYHPQGNEDLLLRNALLQECLRPDPLPFPIQEEYPLVLSAADTRYSYCMKRGERLCSHANLWPRRVVDPQGRELFRIGLVGNVATDPELQGQGLMKQLMAELSDVARSEQLDALILWSDLTQFYHKLGFSSVGKEFRFGFHSLTKNPPMAADIQVNPSLDDELLDQMIAIRPSVPLTLERSRDEFRTLLRIPWLDVFVWQKAGRLKAYAISGKGYDMLGVIHEWGVADQRDLKALVHFVAGYLELEQTLLLGPGSLSEGLRKELKSFASQSEKLPMALIKCIKPGLRAEDFQDLFVWGCDSI